MNTVVRALTLGQVAVVVAACVAGALLVGAVGLGGVVILPALLLARACTPEVGIVSLFVAFTPTNSTSGSRSAASSSAVVVTVVARPVDVPSARA